MSNPDSQRTGVSCACEKLRPTSKSRNAEGVNNILAHTGARGVVMPTCVARVEYRSAPCRTTTCSTYSRHLAALLSMLLHHLRPQHSPTASHDLHSNYVCKAFFRLFSLNRSSRRSFITRKVVVLAYEECF